MIYAAVFVGGMVAGFLLLRLLEARDLHGILRTYHIPRGRSHFSGVRIPKFLPRILR